MSTDAPNRSDENEIPGLDDTEGHRDPRPQPTPEDDTEGDKRFTTQPTTEDDTEGHSFRGI